MHINANTHIHASSIIITDIIPVLYVVTALVCPYTLVMRPSHEFSCCLDDEYYPVTSGDS